MSYGNVKFCKICAKFLTYIINNNGGTIMSTKIIGATTKLFNNFTETGRLKNKMYKDLSEIGMREIRQRAVSKDKFVLMASKEKGCGKSNMTFGVDLKKGYIQKQYTKSVALLCFDKRTATITKIFSDWKGNLLRRFDKIRVLINGKTFSTKSITEVPGKYTKRSEIGNEPKRNISINFANGNTYRFTEYENGQRVYNKNIDGVEYSFAAKN